MWFYMGTDSEASQNQPKYQVVAKQLARDVEDGIYLPGEKLPSIRQLQKKHGVAKNTVIAALQLLETKQLVVAKPRSGFVVTAAQRPVPPATPVFANIQPLPISIPELLQDVIARGAAFDIKPDEPVAAEHQLINKLHRKINRAMRTQSTRKTLYYDDPMGLTALREQLARHYVRFGLSVPISDICITSGCQHALLIALMATCQAGDNVVVESPGFYGAIQLLAELGLNAIEVPCNTQSGLDIDILAEVSAKYDVRACIVTPAFSTPTGACMPDTAKQALLSLAAEHDFAVIEDDIYGDLGFQFRPKPIKSFDSTDRVILCSSFSKSLSRDLRTGWIMGARWHKRVQRLKLVTQLANNQAIQRGLYEFLGDGSFARFLKHRVQQLELQRNALIDALIAILGDTARFSYPLGGLSLWLELPQGQDGLALYRHALQQKIVLTPGALFTSQNDLNHFLRLSFCHPLTRGRMDAIRKIGQLVNIPK